MPARLVSWGTVVPAAVVFPLLALLAGGTAVAGKSEEEAVRRVSTDRSRSISVVEPGEAEAPIGEANGNETGESNREDAAAGDESNRTEPFVEEVDVSDLVDLRRPPLATHVSVVNPEELRRAASPAIDDALRGIGGFKLFRRTSSVVANPTIMGASLRGGGPSGSGRAAVSLDGLPLDDPFGGWIMWSRMPRLLLGGALVSRPGAPLGAGEKALTGSVALETRPPAGRYRAFEARYGTDGTIDAGAALVEALGRGHLSAEARYFETDGYEVVRERQRGSIDVPARSETSAIDLGWSGDDTVPFSVSARLNAFSDERGSGTPMTGNETDGVTASLSVRTGGRQSADAWLVTAFASDQTFANRFSAQAADRSTERPALDQRAVPSSSQGVLVRRESGRIRRAFSLKRIAGETLESFFFVGDAGSGAFTRERRAGGEQWLAGTVWIKETRSFEIGLGLDYWRSVEGAREERDIETGATTRSENFADRGRLLPQLRVAWRTHAPGARRRDDWWIAASVASRPPTLNELYRPFRVRNEITEANGALEPEIGSGVDGGVVWRIGARGRARLTASAFWNAVSDAIANVTLAEGPGRIAPCGFVPMGGVCRQRRNLGRVDVSGMELELEAVLGTHWRASFHSQVTDAEVRRAPSGSSLDGKRLAQVPRQAAILAVTHERGRFSGRMAARYEGEQFEDDLNERTLAAFVAVDATAEVAIASGWSLFGGVENLFDVEIETGESPEGIVSVGVPRQLHVGLRFRTGD